MNAEDFRKVLEQTDDKLSIFASRETLNKYKLSIKEFFDLISDFLSDEEKLKLFDYPHFQQFNGRIKGGIIGLISDDNIMLQMLGNDNITNGIITDQIVDIIKKMSDTGKQQVLHNQEFIEKHKIPGYELKSIVLSLSDEARAEILMDTDLITNKLHFTNSQITELAKGLSSEEVKKQIIERYQLPNYLKSDIINTFNDVKRDGAF